MTGGWVVEARTATAAELHADDEGAPGARRVRIADLTDRAVVLGSTQQEDLLDHDAVAAAGLAVVRRRTGGGLVRVGPGHQLWVDLWLPAGDPLLVTDVSRSFDWLGAAWVEALAALDVAGEAHRGALACGRWGRLICFAGVGPGEVTVGGRKVVGLSQRRGRWGARFQAAALLRWEPAELASVVALDARDREAMTADLAEVAAPLAVDADELGVALVAALPTA